MAKQAAKKVEIVKSSPMDDKTFHELVAREAYLRAEKRGFNGGDPVHDWLQAEKDVSEKLNLDS